MQSALWQGELLSPLGHGNDFPQLLLHTILAEKQLNAYRHLDTAPRFSLPDRFALSGWIGHATEPSAVMSGITANAFSKASISLWV